MTFFQIGGIKKTMTPQETLTRREFLKAGFATILAACAPETQGSPQVQPTQDQRPATSVIPTAAEKAPDKGWSRFRSLNYPYQIDYPQDWSAQSTQLMGKKIDIFKGEVIDNFQVNVNILAEPVQSWVKVEDYVQNYLSQVEQIAVNGKRSVLLFDRNELKGLKRSELNYRDGVLYDLINTDVVGQRTYMVDANINNPLGSSFRYVSTLTAIFIENGQAWQVTFSSSTRLGNEAAPLPSLEKFQKMLASFKFIK